MGEFLGLADFSGARTLFVHELAEIVVVNEYKHLMLGSFKVALLSLKRLNNS